MAFGKIKNNRKEFEAPKLQITSMMDMFTIILIFLLFSFSTKPDTITLEKDLKLPESAAQQDYNENIKLILSQKTLTLEDEVIAQVKENTIIDLDPERLKESVLYKQLKLYRDKADNQKIEKTAEKAQKPKEHILFFCDKRLPFKTINTVMKTAGMAGYPNFQFAVLKK